MYLAIVIVILLIWAGIAIKEKLTPRWQYGIWFLLIIRIFVPVRADKLVVLPFGIYLEILKRL